MKKVQLLLLAILFATQLLAQTGVVISETPNDTPDASAILDVRSTTQGLLPPRLTSSQRDLIDNPAIGLMIYNKSRHCIEFFNGNEWTSSDVAGTIKPFAGESSEIPLGWMLCDGRALDDNDYPELSDKIKTNWGDGSDDNEPSTSFNIPNLYGQFLRGADLSNSSSAANENRTGGSSNEKIGSLQDDEFKSHNHKLTLIKKPPYSGNPGYLGPNFNSSSYNNTLGTTNTGGSETRPTNAYVNYIIKY